MPRYESTAPPERRLVGCHEFRIGHFGFEPHVPVGRFFVRLDQECEPVLVVESLGKFIQKRTERDWRTQALEIGFASGLIGQLG